MFEKIFITVCGVFVTVSSVQAEPVFQGNISAIPPHIATVMQRFTWRPACPVKLSELAYLRLSYWGFDRAPHVGEMIVNQKVAAEVVAVFKKLYAAHFPIERMQLMDQFQGDDDVAMAHNNTSAFNCRTKTNRPNEYSLHSYGVAVDINTRINPYVKGDEVLPPSGAAYRDRTQVVPGMIVKNGLVYRLFKDQGWAWGGDWQTRQDYQHFEKPTAVGLDAS